MSIPKWADRSDQTRQFFHTEWGKLPESDDQAFELFSLLVFQTGLSWATVLRKRCELQVAFNGFAIEQVAAMEKDDVERLVSQQSPIKNERKIRAVIHNARALMRYRATLPQASRELALLNVLKQSAEETADRTVFLHQQIQLLHEFFRAWGFTFTGPKLIEALLESFGIAQPRLEDSLDTCD